MEIDVAYSFMACAVIAFLYWVKTNFTNYCVDVYENVGIQKIVEDANELAKVIAMLIVASLIKLMAHVLIVLIILATAYKGICYFTGW